MARISDLDNRRSLDGFTMVELEDLIAFDALSSPILIGSVTAFIDQGITGVLSVSRYQ